jgi:hypothetical protein
MRTALIAVLVAIAGVMASEPAAANGRARVTVGVGYGWGWGPYWGPWYYPPPYYYSPVVIEQGPTTYIEQASPQAPVDQTNWWYYCDQSRGYYPYVKECPGGWMRVPPTPPDTTSR